MNLNPTTHATQPTRVSCREGYMSGRPCIDGTRVPVDIIIACVNGGESVYEILYAYPYLPTDAVDVAVEWALKNGIDVSLPVRRMPESYAGLGR
jgi:uncharacterized protein (DUF433 family)